LGGGVFLRLLLARPSGEARYITTHGFRTTFGGWAEDHDLPDGLIKLAIAHAKSDDKGQKLGASDAAYLRRDKMEKRRPMMQA
jgi:hypothetical protein